MLVECPDCDWTIHAEDEQDAADMLQLHRVVVLEAAMG